MKIDYLDDINSDDLAGKMLRITSFTSSEVKSLVDHLQELSHKKQDSIRTGEMGFIESENCSLEFQLSEQK